MWVRGQRGPRDFLVSATVAFCLALRHRNRYRAVLGPDHMGGTGSRSGPENADQPFHA